MALHPLFPGGLALRAQLFGSAMLQLIFRLGLGVVSPLVAVERGEGKEDFPTAGVPTGGAEWPVGVHVVFELLGGLEALATAHVEARLFQRSIMELHVVSVVLEHQQVPGAQQKIWRQNYTIVW